MKIFSLVIFLLQDWRCESVKIKTTHKYYKWKFPNHLEQIKNVLSSWSAVSVKPGFSVTVLKQLSSFCFQRIMCNRSEVFKPPPAWCLLACTNKCLINKLDSSWGGNEIIWFKCVGANTHVKYGGQWVMRNRTENQRTWRKSLKGSF